MEKSANFITRQILDHTLLIPIRAIEQVDGVFLKMNESASFLWNRIETFQTKEQMTQALVDRYHIDFEQAAIGVDSFLGELEQFKVIQ